MIIEICLATLGAAGSVASIGGLALNMKTWLNGKHAAGSIDPAIEAALDKLPIDSVAADIVEVLKPFYAGVGGNVNLAAGSNGGGNTQLERAQVVAGSGKGGGGNVRIVAGDGGPNGKGGDIRIVGGTFKAGDAT